MMVKNKDLWKDKAQIIGISIDSEKQKLKTHVETKKWGDVTHYFRA